MRGILESEIKKRVSLEKEVLEFKEKNKNREEHVPIWERVYLI